jgi:cobalamin-independent methionine synthase catalytic subunit
MRYDRRPFPFRSAMFATLLGRLPRPPSTIADGNDDTVRAALAAQESAGLELLSDGGLRGRPATLADWLFAAGATKRPVKQSLAGPYTAGRAGSTDPAERRRLTLAAAEALNTEVRSLRDAGCTFVQIDEPAAVEIGTDRLERALFADAHRRLSDGVADIHLSLATGGGSAEAAGAATFFDLPYASYAFDLIAGPDNWRLITSAPPDRGIVCGAMSSAPDGDERPETLVWAAHYAASGRGLERVALANAPGLEALSWEVAIAKLARVAEAARIAALPSADALAESLDPRAVSSRSAALGRAAPPLHRARGARRTQENDSA